MFRIVDGQLQETATQSFPESGSEEFITAGFAMDRLTLRQILLAGPENIVHFNKAFVRYEQQQDGRVCVYFTDGTSASGDVLVAADGVCSRIREQFLPHAMLIKTSIRWLGGKTRRTDEIISLLPVQMHDRFVSIAGSQSLMMFGCVWFRTPPNEAAALRLRCCPNISTRIAEKAPGHPFHLRAERAIGWLGTLGYYVWWRTNMVTNAS